MTINGKFGINKNIHAASNTFTIFPIGLRSKIASLPNEPYKNNGIVRKFQAINKTTLTATETVFFRLVFIIAPSFLIPHLEIH